MFSRTTRSELVEAPNARTPGRHAFLATRYPLPLQDLKRVPAPAWVSQAKPQDTGQVPPLPEGQASRLDPRAPRLAEPPVARVEILGPPSRPPNA